MSTASKKVLVVGGGCAGLGCAWHLNRSNIDVTLYESDSKVGGHANTINGEMISMFTMNIIPVRCDSYAISLYLSVELYNVYNVFL